ncbi:hypothetical protein DL98DRAFT_584991 [Cadophora sp. DSE1049]|nr:hypothetical protein DL98DRAFT_584991 [Cadophora sp. DSE1049]
MPPATHILVTMLSLIGLGLATICWISGQIKPKSGIFHPPISNKPIQSHQTIWVRIPNGWEGMFRVVYANNCNDFVTEGEVKFQANLGKTFFDVSAIRNPNYNNGLHWSVFFSDFLPLSASNRTLVFLGMVISFAKASINTFRRLYPTRSRAPLVNQTILSSPYSCLFVLGLNFHQVRMCRLPCSNAFLLPDDPLSIATYDTDLTAIIGVGSVPFH